MIKIEEWKIHKKMCTLNSKLQHSNPQLTRSDRKQKEEMLRRKFWYSSRDRKELHCKISFKSLKLVNTNSFQSILFMKIKGKYHWKVLTY